MMMAAAVTQWHSSSNDHDTGLCRGMTLALVGVSTGALLFMRYEQMKSWTFERKQRRRAKLGCEWTMSYWSVHPKLN